MKTTLRIIILASFFIISLHSSAQTYEQTLEEIQNTSLECLLERLNESQDSVISVWVNYNPIRYEVIKKLDTLVECRYVLWNDPSSINEYFDTLVCRSNFAPNYMVQNESRKFSNLYDKDPEVSRLAIREAKDLLFFQDWDLLFRFLQLEDEYRVKDEVEANISEISFHSTLEYLTMAYKDSLIQKGQERNYYPRSYSKRNLELIKDLTAEVEGETYVHYRANDVGKKVVKEIDFYVENDFFFPPGNQDRELTGGGGVFVSTDLFAARWFNLDWLFRIKKNKEGKIPRMIPSYQTLGLAMAFYTPYIRYRNNFALADTLFQYDRPFGSYVYVERSKHRLWPKGLVRQKGTYQVGIIGSSWGRDIQAVLHRDATVESQKVYGWDKQIASGGRWMVQVNQKIEGLLYSNTNKYRSLFAPNWKGSYDHKKLRKKFGTNISGSVELMYGGYLSAGEAGVKFSTSNFIDQSGGRALKPFKKHSIFQFAAQIEVGYRYRRVLHNSLLEGFGYLKTYKDDRFDDDAVSVYTLNGAYYRDKDVIQDPGNSSYDRIPKSRDQLNRNVHLFDFRANLRWRKMSFYWDVTLHSKEYDLHKGTDALPKPDYEGFKSLLTTDGDPQENLRFYEDDVLGELKKFDDRNFYAFGRLGAIWFL